MGVEMDGDVHHKADNMDRLEDVSGAYKELLAKLNTITQLGRCQAVIGYDQQVFMPKNSETAAERGAQMSALSSVIHNMSTDKGIMELISRSESDIASNPGGKFGEAARLLEIERRDFLKNERVPAELAARAAGHQAKAQQSWQVARASSDFALFESDLSECFSIAKEKAECKRDPDSKLSLYSQMIDDFEIGMEKERIDELFGEIREALVPLIAKVLKSENKPKKDCLVGSFPVDKQAEIANRLVSAIGYNTDFGRTDVSTHPFSSPCSPKDVRITSRFTEGEWREGLIATIHEGGHAIYEQSRPSSPYKIDSALSLGAHESQSLFWERHVALSKAFWRYAMPLMKETFGDFDYSVDEVYGAVNAVSPSFIRVKADELTYPLHVILRYQIESDIVAGDLEVKDIPKRWNDDMKSLLDVDVENDAQGCLQDMHWSALAIGYFPTYLIGAATAAQLEHFCRKDIPDFDDLVEKGEFSKLKDWLTEKVHRHGSRFKSLDDMLESQLGEKLNPKYFIDYLTAKYSELYKL
eukprot:CAMPEP_0197448982 /NCGR_PEP_ID=MMETSP1175-20131217/19784_1 /TAXON_ID=1003142 /ORGANISM="Triceratium dubium, Strain CCMP147" /LENGTH=526 /DNA_ID=CAMNT_0042980941 /DNA_START=198 /DNA_END=1778 /DNA_ORIENTATION=+